MKKNVRNSVRLCFLFSFSIVFAIVSLFCNSSLFAFANTVASNHIHNGNHYLGFDATCVDNGSKEYWVCCECHESFTEDNLKDIQNGNWVDTHVSGKDGVGGLSEIAIIPALGHNWVFEKLDQNHHIKKCSRCGQMSEEAHTCEHETISPSGLKRGFTRYQCDLCETSFIDDFDFSLYGGATFDGDSLFFIPHDFTYNTYTINASIHIPTSFSGRAGVVLGNYGYTNSNINIEIYSNGRPRVYFTNEGVVNDLIFNTDIRSDNGVVTMSITIESEKAVSLYVDGILKEKRDIDFVIPSVGSQFVIGGDYRKSNTMFFKGTLYALSIYKDIRTPDEILNDILLADDEDIDCCVSYNLIDKTYLLKDYSYLNRVDSINVSTIEELAHHCLVGSKQIVIENDILIDRPIYVFGDVTLLATKEIRLTRDVDYDGDLFVVGTNQRGDNPLISGLLPRFTIGNRDGNSSPIIIDGNASNMNVEVKGSAIFAINQSIINFYDGDKIVNCHKTGNDRTNKMSGEFSVPNRIGGAAVILKQSAFNMEGGIIDNCSVNLSNIGGNSSSSDYMVSTLGGAVYTTGEFSMTGGIISNCSAYYGGAIYQRGIIRIKRGEISNNTAYDGGAIHSAGNSGAELYIGPTEVSNNSTLVRFSNNYASYRGGAITSSIQSPIIIKCAEFINNRAEKNCGGAVYTSGPLTIRSSLFDGNYAGYGGGSIYHFLSSTEYITHYLSVQDSVFTNNIAMNKGAGICLGVSSSIDDQGTIADVKSCIFDGNYSKETVTETIDDSDPDNPIITTTTTGGSGGALYATGHSTLNVDDCLFENNKADNMGSCLNSTGSSKISLTNSTFNYNWSNSYGGAVSLYGGTTATLENLSFNNNSSDNNAGALYLNGVVATFNNVNFYNNSGLNGGAMYITNNAQLTLVKSVFSGNISSGTGGAIYSKNATLIIEGKNVDDVLFDGNESTGGGGALSCVEESVLSINGASFRNNHSGSNGGAIYLYSKDSHSINNAIFENNRSNANGGALYIGAGGSVLLDNITANNNSANYGGFAYITSSGTVVTLLNIVATNNAAKKGNSNFIIVNNSNAKIRTNKQYIIYNYNVTAWELNTIIVGVGSIEEIEDS